MKVETPEDIVNFVEMFVTVPRLEQGVTEIGGVDATKTTSTTERSALSTQHSNRG